MEGLCPRPNAAGWVGEEAQQVDPPESQACGFVDCEGEGSCQEVPDEGTQPTCLPPSPPPPAQVLQATCPLRVNSATQAGNTREECGPVLDAVLKNQETLLIILKNQHMLKDLVDKLQKTMSTIEERVQAIEKEVGVFTQFTQDLCQAENETNWG